MTQDCWCSALVSALFAIHPMNIESVAWISERKGVLSAFFAMVSIFFCSSYVTSHSPVSYSAVLLSYFLGLAAKPSILALPVLLLLLDFWPPRRTDCCSLSGNSKYHAERAFSNVFLHLLVLALSLGITLLVHNFSKSRFAAERHKIESAGKSNRVRELASQWNAFSYTDLTASGFVASLFSRLELDKLPLSPLQRERLWPQLQQTLAYLENPTVDALLRLKTNGLHFAFTPGTGTQERFIQENTSSPADAANMVRFLWPKVNADNAQTSRLTSASLDHIRTAVVTQTNTPGSIFDGAVRQGFTGAAAGVSSGFRYGSGSNNTQNT